MTQLRIPLGAILWIAGTAAAFAQPDAPPVEGAPSAEAAGAMQQPSLILPDTELIDLPTAAIVDHMGFYSRTRFFSNGGILQYLSFGVFPRVNLGTSLNIDRVIGTDDPVRVRRPELQVKIRVFDGDRLLPAVALGFDGQGWRYNNATRNYNQRQRGLYLVGTQEVAIPGLQVHGGINISDFDDNPLNGMLAASLNIQDKVKVMVEWDNINTFAESRFNAGSRLYITPAFNIELSFRGIGQGGRFPDGNKRGAERIAQFKYIGSF